MRGLRTSRAGATSRGRTALVAALIASDRAVLVAAVTALALLAVGCGGGASAPPPASGGSAGGTAAAPAAAPPAADVASSGGPRLAHIFVIVDENKAASEIVGSSQAPFINTLIARSALATDYSALFHPSLPNYIALIAGSNQGITSDQSPDPAALLTVPSIADRIAASGRTWKAYAEDLPASGDAGADSGRYAVRHEPFVYLRDVGQNTPSLRTHVVDFGRLSSDLHSPATTPDFAFITPNLCNDMHDCPVSVGDRWLSRVVPMILHSAAFRTTPSLLVLTWDEGSASDNHVATILAGNSVKPGYRSGRPYDHYSLLRTIEAAWGLAPLTANDAGAQAMGEFLKP